VNKLRNEYDQYLKNCEDSSEEIIGDLKINEEVAKQIRNLENAYCSKEVDNNFGEIKFEQKLRQLHYIAKGLENIHSRGLVHRDFHPGNILTLDGYVWCYITDLGLSKPASEEDKSKAYGVMPYVAPEVLNKKKGEPAPYSKASDIYSFSIVI
ncbi:2032_t:CDS:2, partial [Funneliformis geosporum]